LGFGSGPKVVNAALLSFFPIALVTINNLLDTRAEYLLRPSGVGGAGDAIVQCARELGVELIVMGKHRLGFVEHLLAGSVAEKVMRQAPCPVLVVQHPEQEFVVADADEAAAANGQ